MTTASISPLRRLLVGAETATLPPQKLTLDHLETNIVNARARVERAEDELAEARSRLGEARARLAAELAARGLLGD